MIFSTITVNRDSITRRSSERESADSLRDKLNVTGGWLPSLTFALARGDTINMFSRMFRRFQDLTIDDPEFGVLRSQRTRFWSGALVLESPKREVPFRIDGAPDPPTSEQLSFLKLLRERFESIEVDLSATLFEGIDPLDRGDSPAQVFSDMKLLHVYVPRMKVPSEAWTISYESELDDFTHDIIVHMKGFEHEGFSMDG